MGPLRDKINFEWRRVRAARSARRAPRDREARAQFVNFVNSPKKFFSANPSETLPQGKTYHQLLRGQISAKYFSVD